MWTDGLVFWMRLLRTDELLPVLDFLLLLQFVLVNLLDSKCCLSAYLCSQRLTQPSFLHLLHHVLEVLIPDFLLVVQVQ